MSLLMANIQHTRMCHQDILVGLRLSYICIGVGQGNFTRGLEEFVRNEALTKLFRFEGGISLSIPILFLAHCVPF